MCPIPKDLSADEEGKAEMKKEWTDLRDRTIRAIFWKNVRDNFLRCQAREMSSLREALAAAGLPALSLDQSSGRKSFIGSYLELMKKAAERKDQAAQAALKKLESLEPLVQLDASIPSPWTDATNPRCD
jgi:hypothetical protein